MGPIEGSKCKKYLFSLIFIKLGTKRLKEFLPEFQK